MNTVLVDLFRVFAALLGQRNRTEHFQALKRECNCKDWPQGYCTDCLRLGQRGHGFLNLAREAIAKAKAPTTDQRFERPRSCVHRDGSGLGCIELTKPLREQGAHHCQ